MRVKVVIDLIEHDVVDFYRLSAAVEHQPELVIIEINLVQEDIDNGAAVKGIIEVALLEHGQEVCDLLCGYDALLLGFNGQLSLQFGFFLLPLVDTFHDGINALPFLKSLPEVFNGGVRVLNGALDTLHGRTIKLTLEHCLDSFCDSLDIAVRQHLPTGCNDHIFDSLLINDLLLTQMFLGIFTGVVVICLAGLTCAAIAGHHLIAVAAEQLCGQQIFFLASASGRGSFVFVKNVLHSFKDFVADNAGHTTRCFFTFVKVSTDVAFVAQQAVQTVLVEVATERGLDLSGIQILDNFSDGFALAITLKDFTDDHCFIFIDIESVIRCDLESKARIAAVGQTLLCIKRHTAVDLLRQLSGVVFRHAFQNTFHKNTGGIISDVLSCRDHTDAVFLKLGFVDGAVIAVSGKAVKLIDKDSIEGVLVAICDHPLELGAVVVIATLRSIDVLAYDSIAVVCGEFVAGLELTFNGLLTLAMA